MDERIPVYVMSNRVLVDRGASALDAVRAHDPALASEVSSNARGITDSRGLPIPAEEPVFAGAIYRVVRVRPQAGDGAGD